MYIIGIDIGTSSTKAVAVDLHGNVLTTAQEGYPTLSPEIGASEQNPTMIFTAFCTCISRITTKLSTSPHAVSLSSAMHSLLCVDENGDAISNLMTWADNRSSEVAVRLKNASTSKTLYAETGTPIHPMSPLCKLIWLRESNPDLFSRSFKFLSIKEYIWFKLFKVFEVDYSIASATGLFNISSCEWDHAALVTAGITRDRLSTPVNTDSIRRGLDNEAEGILRLPKETPFVVGGSDGCLANAGSFATEPGIAALTIGTSGAIRVAGTAPIVNYDSMPFNYRLDEKTLISGGPINNGGIALKWYAESLLGKKLNSEREYGELLNGLDIVPPGSDGLLFLPYILGERAPIWNSESCGVFFGITSRHKQHHFTRAVIEGIVFSLYQIARALEDGGLKIEEVHVSGGFVRSVKWVQLLTNVFGKRVCLLNIEDASAIGAALIAMKALGLKHTIEQQAKSGMIVFHPNEDEHRLYKEKYFPLYSQLYRALILEMKISNDLRKENIQQNQLTS
jgi:gluconokinase